MANSTTLPGDLTIPGDIRMTGAFSPLLAPASVLAASTSQTFTVPMGAWREHDAYHTVLPGTAVANSYLALIGGTHATNVPTLQTTDFGGNAGAETFNARAEIVLPWNYIADASVIIRVHAGMITTVASTACTVDLVVCSSDEDSTPSADLCATAAQSMNSLVFADLDFTITDASLAPGSLLDVLLTVSANDATDLGVMKGCIGSVQLLCDVR